ncbi:N-acetylglucosamine-1-phosphodiester alpha-N-acetylglucosaminidase-like [Ostrea edulis]|uniref:N-acetylglucosamine-1-phosphodiester alpha-N-acetylglucosaminidase-like n=1 Tax=Ostrea edulis TaxID=37623 RepID=UPI0020958D6C|nr:N-acetylglucosamine-1-phosphodiester alpha-N-acetylglucosaminidase-like [Ostrea edulis]
MQKNCSENGYRNKTTTLCMCKDGYTGATCKHKCEKGTYGFACRRNCNSCDHEQCNYISGCPLTTVEVNSKRVNSTEDVPTTLHIYALASPAIVVSTILLVSLFYWCYKKKKRNTVVKGAPRSDVFLMSEGRELANTDESGYSYIGQPLELLNTKLKKLPQETYHSTSSTNHRGILVCPEKDDDTAENIRDGEHYDQIHLRTAFLIQQDAFSHTVSDNTYSHVKPPAIPNVILCDGQYDHIIQ